MSQCPVCLVVSEAENDLCACGYSYNEKQIIYVDHIRSHVAQVAKRSWQELVRLKKRINDIQLKEHGTYSRHPSPSGLKIGWSERRTAEMLGEAQASTSQDIRLAESIEQYTAIPAARIQVRCNPIISSVGQSRSGVSPVCEMCF